MARRRRVVPKKKPSYEPEVERLGRVAATEFLASSVYAWQYQPPVVEKGRLSGRLLSLKTICAWNLARNAHSLEPAHFDSIPWECWKLVWRSVLRYGSDSFWVAKLFGRFAQKPGFTAHLTHHGAEGQLRAEAIASSKIPGCHTHRFENVFANINVDEIARAVRRLPSPWILFDASAVGGGWTRDDFYKLLNVSGLVALDLSYSSIDDTFLYSLASSMSHEGKLRLLAVLCIKECPNVTDVGVLHILKAAPLLYIETSVHLPTKFTLDGGYIEGTKWQPAGDTETARLMARYPLGLKVFTLFKDFGSYFGDARPFAERLGGAMLYDFMVVPDVFDGSEAKVMSAWKRRLRLRSQAVPYSQHNYIFNSHLVSEPVEESSPVVEVSLPIFTAKRTTPAPKKPRKKPRMMKTDVNSFFDM